MNFTQIMLRKLPNPKTGFLCACTPSNNFYYPKSTNNKPPSSSSSSESSSDSDDINQKKKSDVEVLNKLNSLLQQMVTDDHKAAQNKLNLAKPTNKRAKTKEDIESDKIEPVGKQVVDAVKNVAQSIGGDTKQTESELLMKLLNPIDPKQAGATLSEIIKGMKIEREEKLPEQSKAEQVREILKKISSSPRAENLNIQRRTKRQQFKDQDQIQFEKIDLFGSEPLGIFTQPSTLQDSPPLSTWAKLEEKQLKLAITHPPSNYFQQMILWTEQGKVWQFPINNEFGLDEEAKVYFADHVFLEEHLEPWCPTKGPIRHFMELVCVGLSKNPYLTVEAKKQHIEWYKNYFEDKKSLLVEIGAIPTDTDVQGNNVETVAKK